MPAWVVSRARATRNDNAHTVGAAPAGAGLHWSFLRDVCRLSKG